MPTTASIGRHSASVTFSTPSKKRIWSISVGQSAPSAGGRSSQRSIAPMVGFEAAKTSQLPDSGYFAGLALHSVTAPNEEVTKQFRTSITREIVLWIHSEFKRILPQFLITSLISFGVQNGVHFGVRRRKSEDVVPYRRNWRQGFCV